MVKSGSEAQPSKTVSLTISLKQGWNAPHRQSAPRPRSAYLHIHTSGSSLFFSFYFKLSAAMISMAEATLNARSRVTIPLLASVLLGIVSIISLILTTIRIVKGGVPFVPFVPFLTPGVEFVACEFTKNCLYSGSRICIAWTNSRERNANCN
jgi:hypothetical protein